MKFVLIIFIIALIIYVYKLKKESSNKDEHIYNIANILLVLVLLEITLFNINAYRLDFGDYTRKEYSIADYITYKDVDNVFIEIKDINTKVGTLKINMESDKVVNYIVSYSDELSNAYFDLPSKVLVEELENSKSIPLFLSGNTKKIKIKLEIPNGTNYNIKSIILNEPIQFYFNLHRFLIIGFILILIYAIKNFNSFNMPYSRRNKLQYFTVVIVVFLYMGILYWISNTSVGEMYKTDNTSYMKRYVDAFIKGQTYLEEEPPSLLIRIR